MLHPDYRSIGAGGGPDRVACKMSTQVATFSQKRASAYLVREVFMRRKCRELAQSSEAVLSGRGLRDRPEAEFGGKPPGLVRLFRLVQASTKLRRTKESSSPSTSICSMSKWLALAPTATGARLQTPRCSRQFPPLLASSYLARRA